MSHVHESRLSRGTETGTAPTEGRAKYSGPEPQPIAATVSAADRGNKGYYVRELRSAQPIAAMSQRTLTHAVIQPREGRRRGFSAVKM